MNSQTLTNIEESLTTQRRYDRQAANLDLMDLSNPVAVRLSGANIDGGTVASVAQAGTGLDDVQSRGFGILKLVRGSAGQRPRGPGEPGSTVQEVKRDVARR